LQIVILIEKWRNDLSIVKIIDCNVDVFSLWDVITISSHSNFINLNDGEDEDPFNTSIDSLVFQRNETFTDI
jgi:mitochondrial fission protein ELM1